MLAFCVVTQSVRDSLHSVSFGDPASAWAAAAEISAQAHVRYLDAPVSRVLAVLPHKYDDMWTGAKGFYKVEPIVADGGQVVLLAPTYHRAQRHPSGRRRNRLPLPRLLRRSSGTVSSRYRWSDLAHSTHLRGAGTYDEGRGEHDRVVVTLATGIPEAVVRSVNLDYLDPAGIDIAAWAADPETFVVFDAGEDLYRLS